MPWLFYFCYLTESMKDYYAVLGVRSTAHAAEIKRVYRRLGVQYHPDKNPDPAAHAYMAEINEAYDVLGDPDSRAAYDLRRQQGWTELLSGTPAAGQAPPAPRHRDPRYRPRPAPNTSARRERLEMMQTCIPYLRWVNYAGLVITLLFALDYVLPYTTTHAYVTNYSIVTSRNRYVATRLYLDNGATLRVYGFGTAGLSEGPPIRYGRTTVYRTPMSLDYKGLHIDMGYTYRALGIFPMLVCIMSLISVVYRKNVEFFFNTGFVNAVLLLITLWLIL
jgi:hypothetical protein